MNEENKVQIYIVEHDINSVCRICGTASENQLLPIFGNDIDVDLADKIEMYLPVKICEDDILPTKVCSSCADRIFSWDSLYQCCLNADKHFKTILSEEQLTEDRGESIGDIKYDDTDEDEEANQDQQYDEVHLDNYSDDNDEMHIEVDDDVVHVDDDDDDRLEEYSENIIDDNDENDDDFKVEEHHENIKPEDIDKNEVILHEDDIPNVQPYQEAEDIEKDEQIKVNEAKTEKECLHEEIICLPCNIILSNEIEAIDIHLAESSCSPCKLHCKSCNCDETLKVFDRTCQICGERFPKKSDRRKHISLQHDVISCNVCDKNFKTYTTLLVHKSLHDVALEFYKCPICNWQTRRKYNLQVHISSHVMDNYCRLCCTSFNNEHALQRHKAEHSREELLNYDNINTLIQCEFCQQSFNSKLKLYEHFVKVHESKENKFICTKCGKVFESEAILRAHEKSHKYGKYECGICKKILSRYKTYIEHTNSHSNNRPFMCNLCNKSFKYSSNLAQHKNTHNGIKSYNCTRCDRSFLRSYTLENHMKVHRNERNFTCGYCNVKFVQSGTLQKHLKTMHRICDKCGEMVGDKKKYEVHKWKDCEQSTS